MLLLFGLFTLYACGEDVYQEIDQQNSANVENDNSTNDGSGGNTPFTVSQEIYSPYDFNTMYGDSIAYYVTNNTPTIVEIVPYIGLAYYDGADNGIYNTPSGSIDLINGDYPNLYAGSTEYLNLIQGPTLTITNSSGFNDISAFNHCPVKNGQAFDLTGIATTDEIDLLADAGKIYYFDVKVRGIGMPIFHQVLLKQEFRPKNTPTLQVPFGDWDYLGFIVPTTPFVEPFYFNLISNEIVTGTILVPGSAKDESFFSIPGSSLTFRITYITTPSEVVILIL